MYSTCRLIIDRKASVKLWPLSHSVSQNRSHRIVHSSVNKPTKVGCRNINKINYNTFTNNNNSNNNNNNSNNNNNNNNNLKNNNNDNTILEEPS